MEANKPLNREKKVFLSEKRLNQDWDLLYKEAGWKCSPIYVGIKYPVEFGTP